ncbi:MAG: sigma 54-interacting transcriptional regulator [Desulfobacteraceae bacterium]|nr:MAG: sigma 54-interacting transcriptional regulator [Desulfobacteraceae bacterium]
MRWDTATRYQILLRINNAVITRTTREELFRALATELRKHFPYDRLSINLYDAKAQSLSYFAAADGIDPEGISCKDSRPLAKGSISRKAIQSRQPVIIDDLRRYTALSSVGSMVEAGLKATMAFPLIIRNRILGTIHFSFKKVPEYLSELTEVLTDVSNQAAIAVDNMLAYMDLKKMNEDLVHEKRYLMAHVDDYQQNGFFYASPSMIEIMHLIQKVANTDASVLITGETGTGKDYLARYIHNLSSRRDHLFVKISCPALVDSLFETELFGHKKGAFTGADSQRIGRFELAHDGTVFLDEVSELPAKLQAKLLNVLQDRQFERVGDSRPIEVNFRVIAATNKDLEAEIQSGQFRRDLYYRLNTVNIHVPPLRKRTEDIPLLIKKLTEIQAIKINRPAPKYTEQALRRLCKYHWPGNVRELKNLVKRMVILRPGEQITNMDIINIISTKSQAEPSKNITTLADAEREHIEQALVKCGGIVGGRNGAARLLDLPRSTLQYRLKKYSLNPKEYV